MTLIKSISGIRGTIGGQQGDNLTPIDAVKYAADASRVPVIPIPHVEPVLIVISTELWNAFANGPCFITAEAIVNVSGAVRLNSFGG